MPEPEIDDHLTRDQYRRKEHLLSDISRNDGEKNFNKQKYTKALANFNQALRHVPDDVKALVWRSKCFTKLRKLRKALDDVDLALHLDSIDKEAVLQKGHVLNQLGNHEMALVYFNRGAKQYPKCQDFHDGIKRTEKLSTRKGRRMRMTSTGDLSLFTHKTSASKQFMWKKPKETTKLPVPSATFRTRLVHPLVKVHKTPSVHLSESRATSLNSLLASSLESLAVDNKLIDEPTEKETLGKLYEDKQYLEFLLDHEAYKNKKTPLGKGNVTNTAETGLQFLQERTQFWDSLGPLPPPHPTRRTLSKLSDAKSRLSLYTSTDSLNSIGTNQSGTSVNSFDTTASNKSHGRASYRSRYSFRKIKEKKRAPKPEKVDFNFASYSRDEDLIRQMTEIPEEDADPRREQELAERRREEAIRRGEEVTAFVEKEIEEINSLYSKGQLDVCKKKCNACIDVMGRYTEEEVARKQFLLSSLYSCLGNCDMQTKNYNDALENHGHDLMIGEMINDVDIQSRALGNMGRVNVMMGKLNRALDLYNRKAPMCKTPRETSWLFHEIGNCFLMMKIYQYAHESGLKSLKSAVEAGDRRMSLNACVLIGVSEVNLCRYREAYEHFEGGLLQAKILDDKQAQDAMTKALVDVNKKMVTQMKQSKQNTKDMRYASPIPYNMAAMTPASRGNTQSARTNVTVEG